MRFRGIVYRAHDPRWSWPPVSGEGSRIYGGRFNRIAAGYVGMRVPSFAPGAGADDVNLVLWRWSDRRPSRVALIDDEGRLPMARQKPNESRSTETSPRTNIELLVRSMLPHAPRSRLDTTTAEDRGLVRRRASRRTHRTQPL